MKKIIHILVALLLLAIIVLGYQTYRQSSQSTDAKQIALTIQTAKGDREELEVTTEAGNLGDLLEELNDIGVLKVVMEESAYGRFITGMGIEEVAMQDESQGLYWTYTSENNRQCVADGYCSGVDTLAIEDGDAFVFTLGQ